MAFQPYEVDILGAYDARSKQELSVEQGQKLTVTGASDDGQWLFSKGPPSGWFPSSRAQKKAGARANGGGGPQMSTGSTFQSPSQKQQPNMRMSGKTKKKKTNAKFLMVCV